MITLKASVMKNGMKELSSPSPIYISGGVEPHFSPGRIVNFEGFSVDETGKQHYMDATVSYRQTVLRCIEYMKRYGRHLRYWSDTGPQLTMLEQATMTINVISCSRAYQCKLTSRALSM